MLFLNENSISENCTIHLWCHCQITFLTNSSNLSGSSRYNYKRLVNKLDKSNLFKTSQLIFKLHFWQILPIYLEAAAAAAQQQVFLLHKFLPMWCKHLNFCSFLATLGRMCSRTSFWHSDLGWTLVEFGRIFEVLPTKSTQQLKFSLEGAALQSGCIWRNTLPKARKRKFGPSYSQNCLIKCLKGHKSPGSLTQQLCQNLKVTDWLTDWTDRC